MHQRGVTPLGLLIGVVLVLVGVITLYVTFAYPGLSPWGEVLWTSFGVLELVGGALAAWRA